MRQGALQRKRMCRASYMAHSSAAPEVVGKNVRSASGWGARVNMTRSVAVLRQDGAPERGLGILHMGLGSGAGAAVYKGAALAAAAS